MSILLDAVIRQKSQTSQDPLTAHLRTQPTMAPSNALSLILPMVLGGALGAGAFALWHSWPQPVAKVRELVSSSAPIIPAVTPVADIRLYERVSLPKAQAVDVGAQLRGEPARLLAGHSSINAKATAPLKSGRNADNTLEADDTATPLILGNTQLTAAQQRTIEAALATPDAATATADQSGDLLAAFEAALKQVEYEQSVTHEVSQGSLNPIPTDSTTDIPKFGQLPYALQVQVPEFSIVAHVYASSPEKRWLNVDGVELQEGDSIQGKLKIIEIRPRDVVLELEGTPFRVPAI
ncbi:general secretion pathway protein GspB [Shewanella sp. NIFS-20-20]|uniref:general secretion pathway protein GspB n=1 Tax=Shewanella sp. NIFS-20-20 TaxID=2853806 RepID=UPI001C43805E|nr:general secretion pathway protein GspB [Shewanella sp. NIFS-20-20]MBV7314273.1 general secretion pathway protein GspB [Shewanella sp. NIFS-20-20]